jgi:hypothetical protein
LTVEKTAADAESVVGEECHIISAAKGGPRHDPAHQDFDAIENLILLCATHHKQVDDQHETYSAPLLRELKKNHEEWVETKLRDEPQGPRIKRIAQNVPKQLPRVFSGKELLAMASRTFAHYLDHEDDLTEAEVELVGGFAQELVDWRDLGLDDPIERVRTAKRMQDLIAELESAGFYVFSAVENQRLEGGVGAPSPFPVLHLSILRTTNPNIRAAPGSPTPSG